MKCVTKRFTHMNVCKEMKKKEGRTENERENIRFREEESYKLHSSKMKRKENSRELSKLGIFCPGLHCLQFESEKLQRFDSVLCALCSVPFVSHYTLYAHALFFSLIVFVSRHVL